ncbi:MAG TPA: DegT/DnrJ/EryC1/StrS family aminotransferase [Stellaceae bacterium]|nr:DegT/DnrJ/EryC1/StrS family aminotransferase [Stellaceae bacterium]
MMDPTSLPPIPQTDPKAGYLAHKPAIDAAIARVLASGWYIGGAEVAGFEAGFAAFAGLDHAIGCANGTDALVLALRGLGIGRGDRVATVSHTAVATVAAIELAGAEPVLVDIDPATYTLDPASLARTLAALPGIRAVIPVHLYGHPADLPAILELARAHDLKVIEDCSQSHGAMLDGRMTGGFGDVACFSLYPTKNLGALGDGGVLATKDPVLAERIRALCEYGWRERYISDIAGLNSRLDPIQAAILSAKLPHLAADNARRRAIAERYDRGLAGLTPALTLPVRRPGAVPVYHQYVVRHADRDALRQALGRQGIGTNIHYPMPVHLQPAYQGRIVLDPKGLPETERAATAILSLPMYPGLADDQVDRVVVALRESMAVARVA